jgi:hypothetical protein
MGYCRPIEACNKITLLTTALVTENPYAVILRVFALQTSPAVSQQEKQ